MSHGETSRPRALREPWRTATQNEASAAPFGPWRRLKVVLAAERADLWVILVYGVAVGGLSLAVPIATQALVNWAAFGTVIQPVVVLGAIVASLLTLAGVFYGIQHWITEIVQQRIFARMAVDLAWRLPRAGLSAYEAHRPTELVNRFLDVMTIRKTLALILLDGFTLMLQTLIGMVLLVVYSPLLLAFALLLLGSMAFVLFTLGVGAVRTSVAESAAKYRVLGWLEEIARVPGAFRDPFAAELALSRADDATSEYLRLRKAHFRILFRQIVGSLVVQAAASGLLLALGGWMVARQQLTIGQLVAAELVVTPIVGRFAGIGKYIESLYHLLAATEKVGVLFDLPLERRGGEPLEPVTAPMSVQLKQVGWEARSAARPAVCDLELRLEPGERVAIVGGTGAGKSTLLDLMLGLREPTRGTVELDGVDLREVDLRSFRAQCALVRGIDLFDGTLLDNVRVGRPHVLLTDVRRVLGELGLMDMVAALPEGLQTPLVGGVARLSTGEAQRLMIARALVGRPRLLALDQALDVLDAALRERVLAALRAPDAPWTLVVATHVEEVARSLERVCRIEDGRLSGGLRP